MLPDGLVPILILLPNLLWTVFPPRGQPEGDTDRRDVLHRVMEILEWIGRITALVLPFFYRVDAKHAAGCRSGGDGPGLVVLLCRLGQILCPWPELCIPAEHAAKTNIRRNVCLTT